MHLGSYKARLQNDVGNPHEAQTRDLLDQNWSGMDAAAEDLDTHMGESTDKAQHKVGLQVPEDPRLVGDADKSTMEMPRAHSHSKGAYSRAAHKLACVQMHRRAKGMRKRETLSQKHGHYQR